MDDAEAECAVATAIEAGYRLVDTAENYRNERGVGLGIRASGVPREELFVTTKFNREWHGDDLVREAVARSAERLGLDYIDLMLIHWPNPKHDRYVDAWRGLIRLRDEGIVRAIGVSNFKPAHLDRLIAETGEAPDVNQIQLHPLLARAETRAYHDEHGIVTESWSPLGGNGERPADQPIIAGLASRYGKTAAQIVLRWHLQLGLIAIPKSANPERIRENIDIFDFELTSADLAAIAALDRGDAKAADSDRFGH